MSQTPPDIKATASHLAHLVGAVQDSAEDIIAEALSAAEARGRQKQREEDARIAEDEALRLSREFGTGETLKALATAIRNQGQTS